MRGKESSTVMAISVRNSFNRERRFVSLETSTLDMICFVRKREPKWPRPKRTWDHTRDILKIRGVSSSEKELLPRFIVFMLADNLNHVCSFSIYVYMCVYASNPCTSIFCMSVFWDFQKHHHEHHPSRPFSTLCLCGVSFFFHKNKLSPSVCWPLRRIKWHAVHLGEYLSSYISRAEQKQHGRSQWQFPS